jgi:hypothetical protein
VEDRIVPIELLGTGLGRVRDHERSCDYAAVVVPRLMQEGPDSPIAEQLCAFGRTGRCVLADMAVRATFETPLKAPDIRVLELPKKQDKEVTEG